MIYFDMVKSIFILITWSPHSPLLSSFGANIVPNSYECRFSIFIDNFVLSSSVACNTLLALTIFLKLTAKMDDDTKIFWGCVGFVGSYPILMGAASAFGSTHVDPIFSCRVEKRFRAVLGSVTFGLFCVQILQQKMDFPVAYVATKLVVTLVVEGFSCLPSQLLILDVFHTARFLRFALIAHASGPVLNALVLMGSNQDLMVWTRGKLAKLCPGCDLWGRGRSTSETSLTELSRIESFTEAPKSVRLDYVLPF